MTSTIATVARPSRSGSRPATSHRVRVVPSAAPEPRSITAAGLSTEQYNRALADYLHNACFVGI